MTTVAVTIPVAIEVVGPLSSREGPHPGKRRHDRDVGTVLCGTFTDSGRRLISKVCERLGDCEAQILH